MRAPWLGDVLTDAGLTVVKIGNPVGRGRDMDAIYGVVGHDTVTTTGWTDARVDALLRDGRSDLPGPLAQLGLDRRGRFRWVADGRSNHNGYGTWGNDAIGIEVYCAGGLKGREEPWSRAQQDAFIVGARTILEHLGLGRSSYWNPRVAGHKETDPGRKQDPYKIDMNAIRRQIATPQEDDDMTPQQAKMLEAVHRELTDQERHTVARKVFATNAALGAFLKGGTEVNVDVDELAAALSDTLGDDLAQAVGRKLVG